ETHPPAHGDVRPAVGCESAAERQERGERPIHRDEPESGDHRPGASRHATLRDDLRKFRAPIGNCLAAWPEPEMGSHPPRRRWAVLRSRPGIARRNLQLLSVGATKIISPAPTPFPLSPQDAAPP